MSRLHFDSPTGQAELHGSELAWLGHVARGPAAYAWDLGGYDGLGRALALVGMSPQEGPHGGYLREDARAAGAAQQAWRRACVEYERAGRPSGPLGGPVYDHGPERRLLPALETRLSVGGLRLQVAGHDLHSRDVGLNTALLAGSAAVALAAKLSGWVDVHCWVEGGDRAWLADLVDAAVTAGVYRSTLNGSAQGWHDVTAMLRARHDEPVVCSDSSGDLFPSMDIAEWTAPALPDDWMPGWAVVDEAGRAEWDALPAQDQADYRCEERAQAWDAAPDDEQWDCAMRGLRARRPWAQLAPHTLRAVTFGPPVTVYDLLAPDRDERVRVACTGQPAPRDTTESAAGPVTAAGPGSPATVTG